MKNKDQFRNVLVFRPGHLGDTLVALPAFWSIRRHFPDSRLTLLYNVETRNKSFIAPRDVLPKDGLFDHWLPYRFSVHDPINRKIWRYFTTAISILRGRFDAVVYLAPRNKPMQAIKRDLKFFRAIGISNVIGGTYLLENCCEARKIPVNERVTPEHKFFIDLLDSEGISIREADDGIPGLALSADEIAKGNELYSKAVQEFKTPVLVAVGPGSKRPSRIWGDDRFAEVLKSLRARFGAIPVVFGGANEHGLAAGIVNSVGAGINLAGKLTVRESAALLSNCSLYLGNDTGTMHLAAATGVRCVVIFSAADRPGQWEPIGTGHEFLRKKVECEGCHLDLCPKNNLCLTLIGPNDALRACERILESPQIRSAEHLTRCES